ncbi:MAG: hypothetical protein ACOCOT_06190, partial [Prevotella sp.]
YLRLGIETLTALTGRESKACELVGVDVVVTRIMKKWGGGRWGALVGAGAIGPPHHFHTIAPSGA